MSKKSKAGEAGVATKARKRKGAKTAPETPEVNGAAPVPEATQETPPQHANATQMAVAATEQPAASEAKPDGSPAPAKVAEESPLEPKQDVLALVADLLWQYGTKPELPKREDYEKLLAGVGLKKEQVTKKVLAQARDAYAKRLQNDATRTDATAANRLVWLAESTEEAWDTAQVRYWQTQCGNYRVYRIKSSADERPRFSASRKAEDGQWLHIDSKERLGNGYPKSHKVMTKCLEAVEAYHQKKVVGDAGRVTSNKEIVLTALASLYVAEAPPAPEQPATLVGENGEVITLPEGMVAPKKKKASKPAGAPKPTILGYSVMQICHTLGELRWDFDRVQRVVAHFGIEKPRSTLRTYWTDGKNIKYCKSVNLTTEQMKELQAIE